MVEVTPFTEFDALFMRSNRIETALGIGIDSDDAAAIARQLPGLASDEIAAFRQRRNSLVLGAGIAALLGVTPGDELTLIVPGGGPGRTPGQPGSSPCGWWRC